jgi:hypothetical protein
MNLSSRAPYKDVGDGVHCPQNVRDALHQDVQLEEDPYSVLD